MKIEELEEKLQAGHETQTTEFKGACNWDVLKFAKDILALSNVQGGGDIIYGMKELSDGTFQREGLTEEQRASYKRDEILDQMTQFADPHVNLFVEYLKDQNGLQYVVIQVLPFEDVPVICRKDSTDTTASTLYYRSRNRRVESAPVSNSYDMREIITSAVIRLMQKIDQQGFKVSKTIEKQLDKELNGL